MYFSPKLKVDLNEGEINANKEVLQVSITSPMVLNLYINDLRELLSVNAFEVLAYDDDIVILLSYALVKMN